MLHEDAEIHNIAKQRKVVHIEKPKILYNIKHLSSTSFY